MDELLANEETPIFSMLRARANGRAIKLLLLFPYDLMLPMVSPPGLNEFILLLFSSLLAESPNEMALEFLSVVLVELISS